MSGSAALGQLSTAPMVRQGLSLNGFSVALILLCALADTLKPEPRVTGVFAILLNGVLANKVLWLCLAIAVFHLLRHTSRVLGFPQVLAALPALFSAGMAGGLVPWLGLSISLSLFLLTAPGWGSARIGIVIALAAALHKILIVALGELGGDRVLQLEAQLAGTLAGGLLPGLEVEGNALQVAGGHMVVLVWGCSSLTNLGDALLLFLALASSGFAEPRSRSRRGYIVVSVMVLVVATIALNLLRLVLMASDPTIYAYLHSAEGAAWFSSATLGLTVLMGALGLPR